MFSQETFKIKAKGLNIFSRFCLIIANNLPSISSLEALRYAMLLLIALKAGTLFFISKPFPDESLVGKAVVHTPALNQA